MFKRLHFAVALLVAFHLLAAATAQAALVAYWDFNEGTGTTAADASGNLNNGGFQGGTPQWVLNGGSSGMAGDHALRFNGGSMRVEVPHSVSLGSITNQFTMSLWAREITGTDHGHLLVGTNNHSNRNWLFQTGPWGGGQAYFWSSTNGAWQKSLGWRPRMNEWDHIVFTYDGANLRAYQNGVLRSTHGISGGANLPSFAGGALYIGGWHNASFNGQMDDVALWSQTLSIGQINAMRNIVTPNSGSLADYNVLEMDTLFQVYDTGMSQSITSAAGELMWHPYTGTGLAGDVTFDGNHYYVFFADNAGVSTIPEPGAWLLLLSAFACGALRRRRR